MPLTLNCDFKKMGKDSSSWQYSSMTMATVINLVIVIIVQLEGLVTAFNIDVHSVVVYKGEEDSLFGFSVASHRDQGNGWVLIGAPEAQTEQRKWGVHKPGAVFRCMSKDNHECTMIPFDTTGNNNDTGTPIDDKSNQWFGATVTSSGEDGVVVACAPRYVYYSINSKRREPVGTCFTAVQSFSRFSEYSPCRTGAWGYHRQGYCQAGFSAYPTKERLYIGAPGSYYWQGQTYSQNLWNRLDLIATEEGAETEDDTYLGYSLALGSFDNDEHLDLMVGMPRGANLTGKVLFLSGRTMTQLHNVTGSQVGAYFGHSVAVCDVNGDGYEDAVIGAPLHTNYDVPGSYETGRIYIVYQNSENKFRKWHIRDGEEIKGRFGFSIASLGDTDKDGYGDFAVGAPYSGARGEGAVFIYRGSRAGVREKPDQVIYGKTFRENMRGFGFSLSGGVDLDGNMYPDLAVGAPYSDHGIFLRARPVVNLEAEVTFLGEAGNIDMEDLSCETRTGDLVACTQLRVCTRYSGLGVDSRLRISTRVELDTKKQLSSRLIFMDEENYMLEEDLLLTKEVQSCKTFNVYLIPNIRDKLTPIEAKLTVKLPPSRGDLTPVLGLSATAMEYRSVTGRSDDIELVTRHSLNIQKDCGEDNICVPDLRISYKCNLEEYSVGSEERLELNLEIHNAGEDAYEATFYLAIPESVNYVKTEVIGGEVMSSSVPVLCSPPTMNNDYMLKCDLGNPMDADSKANLRVVLQPDLSHLEDVSNFDMHLEVNSSNPDTVATSEDNKVNIVLPVRVKTDLRIRGLSVPEVIRFNRSNYNDDLVIETEEDVGPEIMHIYQVENEGPSDILEAEVYILWPSARSDSPLLYLTAQPWVEGPGYCQFVNDVNTHNLKVDRYRHTYPGVSQIQSSSNDTTAADNEPLNIPRRKRDVESDFLAELNCGETQCTFVSCRIGPLAKRSYTLIRLRSRLWVRSLDNIKRNDVEISSKLVSRVVKLPYGVNPEYLGFKSHHVTTQVLSLEQGEPASIPLWILILAILAGLLFLSLLTCILHKLGFFQRNRPEEYDFDHQVTLQEKPYQGIESRNHLVGQGAQYHLLVDNSNGSSSSHGSSGEHYRFSNGSGGASAGPCGAPWDRSRSSSQRLSNSPRNSNIGTTVYYPGQRHPDFLPGDEAL